MRIQYMLQASSPTSVCISLIKTQTGVNFKPIGRRRALNPYALYYKCGLLFLNGIALTAFWFLTAYIILDPSQINSNVECWLLIYDRYQMGFDVCHNS